MKFWKSFSKRAVLKQLFFVIALFAILIPIAIWDSDTQVKVNFGETQVTVRSDRYNMTILYDDIVTAELVQMPDAGEKVQDGFDNDILICGVWRNDTWGEYTICADRDTAYCVVARLQDGRILVFSQKDDETTQELHKTLVSYLK